MKVILIVLTTLVIIAVGGFAMSHEAAIKGPLIRSESQSASSTSAPSSPDTIIYTDNGFTPAQITIKAGSTVTIKNNAADALALDSDPHPAHTDDTDLNIGAVGPGQSKAFTVSKVGSFGYHNHLNPSQQGMIVIE